MTPLCFLDTETTGVHPGRQVWEIAMIRRDDSGETEASFFVDVDLSAADPFGLSVGRFYERHPHGQYLSGRSNTPGGKSITDEPLTVIDAAHEVARMTHGAHIVGIVPNFDTETLDPLLRAHGLIPAWHYHLIDVEAMAVGYLRGRGWEDITDAIDVPWRSDDLSRACGVEPPSDDERHTALGDARWAQRWYDAITGGA
jgi:hypothetical protein